MGRKLRFGDDRRRADAGDAARVRRATSRAKRGLEEERLDGAVFQRQVLFIRDEHGTRKGLKGRIFARVKYCGGKRRTGNSF